ncbi:ABC transporter ATP-binding protein [Microvirga alba]|uniref:ABC transporter ATP-binding protein n=1 Tax=Microvirga alba TaxID=2791025 RepID=A0A931BWY7_9HYPH|nr:ABC transporter ATP-binding protein [Microvirga alba]MBF9235360.1 ABC transporter ATP-binding protein [Microvirga alba]
MTLSLSFKKRGITLTGLSVELQGKPILDNVDLEILPGEIIALLGPSGCGKTTMLRAIAGLQRPTAGEIVVGGQAMNDVAPYRRNVGMVFQSYALFPHMTVAENILFGLKMHGVAPAERQGILEATLSMLELGSLRDAYPARLSGGQQQRVAIARSIATQPSVLLLDEPLSALDKKLKDDMRNELRNLLKKVGMTAIIVTHDQEEALAIADRVAVMENGRIAQIGTGGDLYHHPNCRFVADFVGYMNYFDGRVSGRSDRSVDLDIGRDRSLKARAAAIAPSQDDVIVAVRPEAIRPVVNATPIDREAFNSVTARLIGEEFLGIITNLRFQDDEGRELLVIRSGHDNRTQLRAGERYALIWPIDATILMPTDAS